MLQATRSKFEKDRGMFQLLTEVKPSLEPHPYSRTDRWADLSCQLEPFIKHLERGRAKFGLRTGIVGETEAGPEVRTSHLPDSCQVQVKDSRGDVLA